MSEAWQHQAMDESNTRLRQARKNAGFKSASAAAKRYGWKGSTYASHENGQTPVPREAAEAYAKKFKVDLAWLLAIEGSVNQQPNNAAHKDNLTANRLGIEPDFELDAFTRIPEIELRSGAVYAKELTQEKNIIGQSGKVASKEVVRATWGIPSPFLTDELHIAAGRANIVRMRGDSMKDALFDGDRAIIDLDDTNVSQGGIFALLDDNAEQIIRQVEIVRGSKAQRILCTSRNAAFTSFELDLVDPVMIIGRVAGRITRL